MELYRVVTHSANRPCAQIPGDVPVKLTNLKITPKLGILVGVTLLGLCIAGLLAGYLMKREMVNARIDQAKSIVDMARNMAGALKTRVDAGEITKDAAMAELRRYGNAM